MKKKKKKKKREKNEKKKKKKKNKLHLISPPGFDPRVESHPYVDVSEYVALNVY